MSKIEHKSFRERLHDISENAEPIFDELREKDMHNLISFAEDFDDLTMRLEELVNIHKYPSNNLKVREAKQKLEDAGFVYREVEHTMIGYTEEYRYAKSDLNLWAYMHVSDANATIDLEIGGKKVRALSGLIKIIRQLEKLKPLLELNKKRK